MILQIVQNIWTGIRKELKDVELHIYGVGRSQIFGSRKKQLQKMGIYFKGFMQDLADIQKYRAFLYPLQYTTGTKGVIIESWFHHTPVVTTPVGA